MSPCPHYPITENENSRNHFTKEGIIKMKKKIRKEMTDLICPKLFYHENNSNLMKGEMHVNERQIIV